MARSRALRMRMKGEKPTRKENFRLIGETIKTIFKGGGPVLPKKRR